MTTATEEKTGKAAASEKHVLHELAQAAPGKGFGEKEEALHSALLLGFYRAAQAVVSKEVIVPVLYGISYDSRTRQIKFVDHGGKAPVPSKDRTDMNWLDLIIAATLRGGMPLLLEGDTGTGKTLLTEKFLSTILEKANYVGMTLSQNQFTNNPLQPFTRKDTNDVTKTHLDRDALQRVAVMFIDELNRGQTQVLLQLAYGRVQVGGEFGEVGIPVPELTPAGVEYPEDGRKKKMLFIGAQNPSQQKDATFTETMQLDAALSNRLLTVGFPSLTRSAGASVMVIGSSNGLHGKFLESVAQYVEKTLAVKVDRALLKEQWLPAYAYITDPKRTDKAFLRSSLEFADVAALALAGNIASTHEQEKAMIADWDAYLAPAVRTSFSLGQAKIDATSQEVQRLEEIVGTFEKETMPRDLAKIKVVADIFATVRGLKAAFRSDKPLQAYAANSTYVTVEDIAAAATLVAKSKQFKATADPITIVNSVLTEYTAIIEDAGARITGRRMPFESNDPASGLLNYTLANAWVTAKSHKDIIQKLNEYAGVVKGLATAAGSTELRRLITARAVGDLATFSGFMLDNAAAVDSLIASAKGNVGAAFSGLKQIYEAQRDNPLMPDVYKHRLEKMLA